MASRFTVSTIFKAVDLMTAPIRKMTRALDVLGNTAVRVFTRMDLAAVKFNRTMSRITGRVAGAAGIGGFVVANAIGDLADFERALGAAAAKFPVAIQRSTKEFQALRDAAREVGAATEFTATDAAKGLGFLAKAGKDAEFSMQALVRLVDFATASELGLARATDIATDAVGSIGLKSDTAAGQMADLNRVLDVFAKSATSSNFSVEELFESFKLVAPVAKKIGVELETVTAILGTMANAGIKGSIAGTSLKNIFLGLSGVTNQSSQMFRRLGISLEDLEGNVRNPLDLFDELRQRISGFGGLQQITVIEAIFGKIPLAAVGVLLDQTNGSMRAMVGTLRGASGASSEMATAIRDDLKGSIDNLMSSFLDLKIGVLGIKKGGLRDIIDGWTEGVRNFTKAVESSPIASGQIMTGIAELVKGALALLVVLKLVGLVTIVLTRSFLAFSKVMAGLKLAFIALRAAAFALAIVTGGVALPFLAVAAAIAAVVTVGVLLIRNWDTVIEKATQVANVIKSIPLIGSVFRGAEGAFTLVQGLLSLGSERDAAVAPPVTRSTTSNVNLTIDDKNGAATIDMPATVPGINITFQQPNGAF